MKVGVIPGLILLFAVAFNLCYLYSEVGLRVPMLHDGVLHLLNLQRVVAAIAEGQDPTDVWLGGLDLGYPLFHHYQHLAYLPPALLYLLFQHTIPLDDVYRWTNYLLLSLFPVTIYFSMRWFGFGRLPSALAGLVAPLLATDGLYGFDFGSYVWRGYGLYTQLWGMLLLPLALGRSYVTLRQSKGYFWSVLLLAATLMSHLVSGYIAFVSLGLFAVLPALGKWESDQTVRDVGRRALRFLLLLALTVLVIFYFLLPFVLDGRYMNRSVWELPTKYDSYGYEWVLSKLVTGQLFDFGRFPSLTILVALGLGYCLWRWRDERYRLPVALSLLWLLLYFGRPTWGVLLDALPLSQDLHLHRLIAGVHLGGIYLMGIGLALPWHLALNRVSRWVLLAPATLTLALLYPAYSERADFLAQNTRLMEQSQAAYQSEQGDIADLIDWLKHAPPGRVYAGLGATWGQDYRVGAVPMYAVLQSAGLDMMGYMYHALSLNAEVQLLFDDRRPEQYDLFNVRYVVAPKDRVFPAFVKPVREFGRHRVYEVTTSGYFDLVDSSPTWVGTSAQFYSAASRWLASSLPRAAEHPVMRLDGARPDYVTSFPLDRADALIPPSDRPIAPPAGRILYERAESSAYVAEIEAARDSLLMLKATYHPDLTAYVDGRRAGSVMVMPSYAAVNVGPGNHSIRFEYQPPPWRTYLIFLGLLVLAIIAVVEWRFRGLLQRGADSIAMWPQWPRERWHVPGVLGTKAEGWYESAKAQLAAHLPFLAGVFLAALLAGLPMFQFKLMSGHDVLAYLPRNTEFFATLRAGDLFPRWAADLNFGYGEPLFNFNPPVIYYLSSAFHVLGFNFIAAGNLADFALLLLAGIGMYVLAAEFFGRLGGLVAAVAYVFAPYVLVVLYVRAALADFAAFAFIPLLLWGLYCFARFGRSLYLAVGASALALLLLSSNPVALITFPILLLLPCLIAWRLRDWWPLARGVWCLALGLGLSAFFWAPALLERNFVQVSRVLQGYLNYGNHFVYPQQLVYSPWGYGLSLPGLDDEMSFALGPVHLVSAIVAVVLILAASQRQVHIWGRLGVVFFLIVLLYAALFSTNLSAIVWDRVSLLNYLEFPWRFLSLAAVATAFLCGLPFLLIPPERRRLRAGLAAGVLVALFVLGFPYARPQTFLDVNEADYSPATVAVRDIAVTTVQEYTPIWVSDRPERPAQARAVILSGAGEIVPTRRSPTEPAWEIRMVDPGRIRANIFYFPGWTLYVDGVQRAIDFSNLDGVMEFSLEAGEHNVELIFADTPTRMWSSIISWLSLLVLATSLWLIRRKQLAKTAEVSSDLDSATSAVAPIIS